MTTIRSAIVIASRLDFATHLHAQLGVEVGQRLVEQEDGGVPNDGAAHRDPLALAPGQFLGVAMKQIPKAQNFRGAPDLAVDFGLRRRG
jgi:hypothetical protein